MNGHQRSATIAAGAIALAAAAGCTSPPAPKVSVAIAEKPNPVQPAAVATYLVTVRNTGTVTVTSSSLDVGLYANAQPAPILGEPRSCQATATMRICQVGPLAPGQVRALTFYVRAPGGGTLTGRATYLARSPQQQVTATTPTVTTPVTSVAQSQR